MIKKIGLLILGLFALTGASFASDYNFSSDYGLDTLATVTINAQAGRSIALYAVKASTDLSGAVVTLSIGAAAGTTANVTAKGYLSTTINATTSYGEDGLPVYKAPVGYLLRVDLTSTAKNSLILGWKYE